MAVMRSALVLAATACVARAGLRGAADDSARAATAAEEQKGTSALLARLLQARNNVWTTDHGNFLNSGSVPGPGPAAQGVGFCREVWVPAGSLSGALFASTGVSTTAFSSQVAHFVGDTAGTFWFITDSGLNAVEVASLPVQMTFGTTSLSGQTGFFAPPATTFDAVSGQDLIIAPSLDGNVYAMSQLFCTDLGRERAAQKEKKRKEGLDGAGDSWWPASPASPPSSDEQEEDAAAPGSPLSLGPGQCAVWVYSTNTRSVFSSPPRVYEPLGAVYVSESDPLLQTGSNMYALNVSTGLPIWANPYQATYQGTPASLAGIAPAVVVPYTGGPGSTMLAVTVGMSVVLINATTGLEIAAIDTTTQSSGTCVPTFEVFASPVSVIMTGDEIILLAQTSTGSLWFFSVLGDNAAVPVSLTCLRACAYNVNDPDQCSAPIPPSEEDFAAGRDLAPGGGWYTSRTTRAQRDELHAAIRHAHAEAFGPEAGLAAAAELGVGKVHAGQVLTDPSLEVAALARDLPRATLDALLPPHASRTGYTRRGWDGKVFDPLTASPAQVALAATGDAVLAPASLSPDGVLVALPSYGGGLTNSPLGVAVVKVLDGSLLSAFNVGGVDGNGNPVPYARSRSAAVFDGQGNLYVAADWDFSLAGTIGGGFNDTLPSLVNVANPTSSPSITWAMDVGREGSGSLGLISPIITDGTGGIHRIVIAGPDGSLYAAGGCAAVCPSSVTLAECSGHGKCDGTSGNCSCASAWNSVDDPTCNTFVGCDFGAPQPDGSCECTPCHVENDRGQCSRPRDCKNGGFCEVVNGSSYNCLCPYCYGADPFQGGLCLLGPADCGLNSTGCVGNECTCEPCFQSDVTGTSCIPFDCGQGGQCTVGPLLPGQNGTGTPNTTCACAPCWELDGNGLCNVQKDCGVGGSCGGDGTCVCDTCYLPDGNGACNVQKDCGVGGTCNGDTGGCDCETCYNLDGGGACNVPTDCGPGGQCSLGDGSCQSDGNLCYSFNDATNKFDRLQTCDFHGTCNTQSGLCTCLPGWNNASLPMPCASCDACHMGVGTCASVFPCSGNGVCTLGASASSRVCVCAPGWSGPMCDQAAGGPDNGAAGAGTVDPVVAAGVGVPVALLVMAGAGFALRRMRRGPMYASIGSAGAGAGGGKPKSSGGGGGSGAGLAPKTFGSIARTAGFDSAGAAAAVARLGKAAESAVVAAAGSAAGAGGGGKPATTDTSSLLGSRNKAAASGLGAKYGGGYGGL